MKTGDNIKRVRTTLKMTQRTLSEKTGIAEPTIRKYESNNLKPKYETIKNIADALGVNPADLDERLIINVGSDVITRTPDGEFVTAPSGTPEAAALTVLHDLNETGQKEWIKRGNEMAKIPDYKARR